MQVEFAPSTPKPPTLRLTACSLARNRAAAGDVVFERAGEEKVAVEREHLATRFQLDLDRYYAKIERLIVQQFWILWVVISLWAA